MEVKGFALGAHSDVEEKAIVLYAAMNRIPCSRVRADKVPVDYIPVGTVEWFLKVTGWEIKPDTFPSFLSSWVKREVWEDNDWPLGQKVFIKPSDRYKRFDGKITDGTYRGKKKPPYLCSEIDTFIDEYRYYIINGKVLYAAWYIGNTHEDKAAPELDIQFPSYYCGAVDFGMTTDRGLALIEAHHPFACGWYGTLTNYEIYGKFIVEGYEYLRSIYE
jgi:hypothetical protein